MEKKPGRPRKNPEVEVVVESTTRRKTTTKTEPVEIVVIKEPRRRTVHRKPKVVKPVVQSVSEPVVPPIPTVVPPVPVPPQPDPLLVQTSVLNGLDFSKMDEERKWHKLIEFVLARLGERNTWIGVIGVITGLGMHLTPELKDMIMNIGIAISSMVLIFTEG